MAPPNRYGLALLATAFAVAAARKLGEKCRQVAVLGIERRDSTRRQEHSQLREVRLVGVQRVARKPALELEIGEKVERQPLEAHRARGEQQLRIPPGERLGASHNAP